MLCGAQKCEFSDNSEAQLQDFLALARVLRDQAGLHRRDLIVSLESITSSNEWRIWGQLIWREHKRTFLRISSAYRGFVRFWSKTWLFVIFDVSMLNLAGPRYLMSSPLFWDFSWFSYRSGKGRPNMRLSWSQLFAVVTSSCGIVISGYSASQFQQNDPNCIHVNMDHVTHCRIYTTQRTTTNTTSDSQCTSRRSGARVTTWNWE